MTDNAPTPCCDDNCCTPESTPATQSATQSADVRDTVRAGYAEIARSGQWSSVKADDASCCSGGGCCGPTTLSPDQVAEAVGYAQEDLKAIPEGANLGLSCGNPTALASLKEGETLLDLGSGAGFDCFIAGPRVGATGHVIGVDMTPDMLTKARQGLAPYRKHAGLDNVEFRLGEIEHLPVPDASVDVVISNCVLNLSPDKPQVWREIARVLKPGGRVAISDLALLKPLPEGVMNDIEALIGCVAGACLVDQLRADAAAAGLTDIHLDSKPEYIRAMTDWQDPLYKNIIERLPEGSDPSDYITSLDIRARRPE
ncbi:MAG: arsenite methyltransferase [Phycisphaerales bacterium JB059]